MAHAMRSPQCDRANGSPREEKSPTRQCDRAQRANHSGGEVTSRNNGRRIDTTKTVTGAAYVRRSAKAMRATSFPRKSRPQNRRLGRSSGFRIVLLAAPSRVADGGESSPQSEFTVVETQRSFPVTAAGPQRNCTVFPILLSHAEWVRHPSRRLS